MALSKSDKRILAKVLTGKLTKLEASQKLKIAHMQVYTKLVQMVEKEVQAGRIDITYLT